MSSIDKYVESTAKTLDSSAYIRKFNNFIMVYVNGEKVYQIADRYGYLSSDEAAAIKSAVETYLDEHDIRKEERRLQAYEEVKTLVKKRVQKLDEQYSTYHAKGKELLAISDFSVYLDTIKDYNLGEIKENAKNLSAEAKEKVEELESNYKEGRAKLTDFEKGLPDLTIEEYGDKKQELSSITIDLKVSKLNTAPYEEMRERLKGIVKGLAGLDALRKELNKMQTKGELADIATRSLEIISRYPIRSEEDIINLIDGVRGDIASVQQTLKEKEHRQSADAVASLEGAMRVCVEVRDYVGKHTYTVNDMSGKVLEKVDEVTALYDKLQNAKYTHCTEENANNAKIAVADILSKKDYTQYEIDILQTLLEEGWEIEQKDKMVIGEYEEYERLLNQLKERGVDCEERFSPQHSKAQIIDLQKRLIKVEKQKTACITSQNYLFVSKAMENEGFEAIVEDFGDNEQDEDDKLAISGLFVQKGMEGVAYQITVSGNSIKRSLVGITKSDGTATGLERVKEVARKLEDVGEGRIFLDKFAEISGSEADVIDAVDADTEYSDAVIEENGYYQLSKEEEEKYNMIVGEKEEVREIAYVPQSKINVGRANNARKKAAEQRARAIERR